MSSIFDILPIEIRNKIFEQCTKRDLLSLALCSRFSQTEVVPLLWRNVSLQHIHFSKGDINSRSHNLCNTRNLVLEVGDRFSTLEAFNFGVLVRNCDPTKLKSLSIRGPVPSDTLRFLSEMIPMLQCLKLSSIDSAAFDHVSNFHNLESVSFDNCDVEDRHMKKICLLKELRRIELEDCGCLTYKSLVYISQVKLKELQFSRTTFLDSDAGQVTLDDTFFDLAERNFTDLERLTISENEISDLSMAAISRFSDLRYLDFYNCPGISNKGVAFLSNLPNLQHLSLCSPSYDSEVTDEGICHLSKLTSLTSLNVYRLDKMTNAALHMISQLPNLLVLDIGGIASFTDEGFAALKNLRSLQHLSMEYLSNITNDSLKIVGQLKYLKLLKMTDCEELTDDGLHHLSNLQRLSKIVCEGAYGLTIEGFERAGLPCEDMVMYSF